MEAGVGVVGVDLDGQIVCRVNELDQDGKLRESAAAGAQPLRMLSQTLCQSPTGKRTVLHGGGAVGVAAELPGLCQAGAVKLLVIFLF